MKTKHFVILIFTILFLLMSGLFLFFQISETDKYTDKEIKEILKTIKKEVQAEYNIKNETIGSFKKGLFYIIWGKNINNNEWYPLIYDKLNLKDSNTLIERDPYKIPKEIEEKAKLLEYSIDEMSFIVWIEQYSITNILKNIILPILIIILIYLIILLIINIFFDIGNAEDGMDYISYNEKSSIKEEIKKETPRIMPEVELSEEDIKSEDKNIDYIDYSDYDDNYNIYNEDHKQPYKKTDKEKKVIKKVINDKDRKNSAENIEISDLNRDNINFDRLSYELTDDEIDKLLTPIEREPENINKNNEKVLGDYKDLWERHFKTSENFKANFPFLKLYNTIKFGITPEKYIENGFDIASPYFDWKNAQIYIKQKNFFVSTKTKEIIDHEYIDLPTKGDKKGDIFIPLFPYSDTIFGYLYFYWDKKENFNIADIIFFLKFFFSEDAKFIFLNYDNAEKTIRNINKLLNDSNEVFVSILSIDDKGVLKETLSPSAKELLKNAINEKLNDEFRHFEIFNISNFTFGMYSVYVNKEEIIEKFDFFIKSENVYDLDNYGRVNLTLSLGIAFSEMVENPNAESLIENSNEKLKRAVLEGGSKIVF